jgi:hypothetical protein
LPVITKSERCKTLFVSQFSPKVTADDIQKTLKEQLIFTRLKTKFNWYASFHISIMEDEFSLINNTDVWVADCLIAPYYGRLTPDQIFTPNTPEAEVPAAAINSAANPASNNGANGDSSTST